MRKKRNIYTCCIMGITESTLKLITEPLNHMIDNCGKSDFKSKCGSCLEIETTHDTHAPCSEIESTHISHAPGIENTNERLDIK